MNVNLNHTVTSHGTTVLIDDFEFLFVLDEIELCRMDISKSSEEKVKSLDLWAVDGKYS